MKLSILENFDIIKSNFVQFDEFKHTIIKFTEFFNEFYEKNISNNVLINSMIELPYSYHLP